MSERKTYAVIGLGIFGSEVAKKLFKVNCDVIAIDNDMEQVEYIARFVQNAVCADATSMEELQEAGVANVDGAVIAMGSHLEASILTVLNLKELGIPKIIVKANNNRYQEVLLKVGATDVIQPEKEMGKRTAMRLMSNNIVDLFDLDEDYSLFEMATPSAWVGKNLKELDLRKQFDINVFGIRHGKNEKMQMMIHPEYEFQKDDQLLITAQKDKIAKLNLD